ncbi:hypothetical protein BDW68DRAFT_171518 [Aspergillus falconensis]
MQSMSKEEFHNIVYIAVATGSICCTNSFSSTTIRWAADDTGAASDCCHIQSLREALQHPRAEELVLSSRSVMAGTLTIGKVSNVISTALQAARMSLVIIQLCRSWGTRQSWQAPVRGEQLL